MFPKEKMHGNIFFTCFIARILGNICLLSFCLYSIKHPPHPAIQNKDLTRYLKDASSLSTRSGVTSTGITLSNGVQRLSSTLSFGTKFVVSDTGLPFHERQSHRNPVHTSDHQPKDPAVSPLELPYLLLCYSQGRYATRLLQLDLVTLQATCDKTLFRILREHYRDMRGQWHQYLSLRTLESIKFVHFEMYRSELVDIRKKDDVPPPTHT
jgi:hypothetical protein